MRTVARAIESADFEACVDSIREPYLQTLTLVERLHRRLLEVIKDEFDRRGRSDISSGAGPDPLQYRRSGAIRWRPAYARLLSRDECPHNLKKFVDLGLVEHQRSRVDRRAVRIKLSARAWRFMRSSRRSVRSTRRRWIRRAASMQTNSPTSTNCCIAWSASGPIRLLTVFKLIINPSSAVAFVRFMGLQWRNSCDRHEARGASSAATPFGLSIIAIDIQSAHAKAGKDQTTLKYSDCFFRICSKDDCLGFAIIAAAWTRRSQQSRF